MPAPAISGSYPGVECAVQCAVERSLRQMSLTGAGGGWEVIVPLHNNDNVPAEIFSIETLPDTPPSLECQQHGMCPLFMSLHASL